MKSKPIKIITILIITVILIAFIIPSFENTVYAGVEDVFDGIAGIITWPLRALIVAFGEVIRLVIGGIASLGGNQSITSNTNIRTRYNII